MEEALNKFVEETGAERGLARDLLHSTHWDYDNAVKSFRDLTLGSVADDVDDDSATNTVKTRCPSAKFGKVRGISVVNSDIVFEARSKVMKGDILETDEIYEHFDQMPNYTFVLPDLSNFPEDLADFLRRDLIETSTLVGLEQAGRLNWWADMGIAQRLVPLATSGDGNCLLHAASLGMWGFHDRLLTLRKALFRTLTGGLASGAIKRRWRFQQWEKNMEAGGLIYSESEWEHEWDEILRIASTQRRKPCQTEPLINKVNHSLRSIRETEGEEDSARIHQEVPEKEKLMKEDLQTETRRTEQTESEVEDRGAFESLEEIHVFVLAHVLRRPIIVVSDTVLLDFSGEPIAPIPFGGIYLPLECSPENCYKCPLLLTFDSAHFSALVACDDQRQDSKKKGSQLKAIPVVGPSFDLLPIHYALDPGSDFDWSTLDETPSTKDKLQLTMQRKLDLLRKYLEIVELKVPCTAKKNEKMETSKLEGSSTSGVEEKNTKTLTSVEVSKSLEHASEGNGKDFKTAAKRVSEVGTWIGSQLIKVGNLAGVIGSAVHSTVYAAALRTDRKPEYYDKMIENYISSARERFEEEKREKERRKREGNDEPPQPCLTPGCQLYGTSGTSYLCTGCYQRQMKEAEHYASSTRTTHQESTFHRCGSTLPCVPYASPPPSYAEACGKSKFYAPIKKPSETTDSGIQDESLSTSPFCTSSQSGSNVSRDTSEIEKTNRTTAHCRNGECDFYGSPENDGFCSACFKKYKQTLVYTATHQARNDL